MSSLIIPYEYKNINEYIFILFVLRLYLLQFDSIQVQAMKLFG